MAKTHSIKGDLELLGIFYMGESDSDGTSRTIEVRGSETNIDLLLKPKGAGVVLVPEGYEASISSDQALVNRAFVNAKIAGVDIDADVAAPGEEHDGFALVYDHDAQQYTLSAIASSLTFEDGLTESGGTVKLGGDIDDAETNVTQTATGVIRLRSRYTTGSDEAGLAVEAVAQNNNKVTLYAVGGSVVITPTAMTITAPGTGAAKYAADYSANYTTRSLPDVSYVNNHIGGKSVDSTVINPTSDEDTYVLSWANGDGTYKLVPAAAGAAGLGGSTGSTDNAVLRANGTGGATVQGSDVFIDDNGNITLGSASSVGANFSIKAQNSSNAFLYLQAHTFRFFTNHTSPGGSGRGIAITNDGSNTVDITSIHSADDLQIKTVAVSGGNTRSVIIRSGNTSGTGDRDSGNVYITTGSKLNNGTRGNIGFYTTSGSFGGGEGVIFITSADTNPSTSVTGGGVMFVKSSDGLPYWRTGNTESPLTISGLTTGRIPYATSSTTIGDDSALTWDATNNAMTIGVARIFSLDTAVANNESSVFLGEQAGNFSVDTSSSGAFGNVAIGYKALNALTEGAANIAIGSNAGLSLTSADGNVFIGRSAGLLSTTGGGNVLIGNGAGDNVTTGSFNVIIGNAVRAQSNTSSSQLSIQNALFGVSNSGSGTIVSSGRLGVYVASPTARLHIIGGASGENGASLKIGSGDLLTTPESGAVESDGDHIYWTDDSGVRHQLDSDISFDIDGPLNIGEQRYSISGGDVLQVTRDHSDYDGIADIATFYVKGTNDSLIEDGFGGRLNIGLADDSGTVSHVGRVAMSWVTEESPILSKLRIGHFASTQERAFTEYYSSGDVIIAADESGAVSNSTIKLRVDGNDIATVTPNGISATAIQTDGTYLKTKVVQIDGWNMDSTDELAVTHGIADYTKIRGIGVTIIPDTGSVTYDLFRVTGADGFVGGGINNINPSTIVLARPDGSFFDSTTFASTSFNRGYLLITYEA